MNNNYNIEIKFIIFNIKKLLIIENIKIKKISTNINNIIELNEIKI